MNKPIGGRGKKAPYQTVVIRVPEVLFSKVNTLIEEYRKSLLDETSTQSKEVDLVNSDRCTYQKSEAIEKAKEILNQKQSAKKSLKNLLQVLYNSKIDENEFNK